MIICDVFYDSAVTSQVRYTRLHHCCSTAIIGSSRLFGDTTMVNNKDQLMIRIKVNSYKYLLRRTLIYQTVTFFCTAPIILSLVKQGNALRLSQSISGHHRNSEASKVKFHTTVTSESLALSACTCAARFLGDITLRHEWENTWTCTASPVSWYCIHRYFENKFLKDWHILTMYLSMIKSKM